MADDFRLDIQDGSIDLFIANLSIPMALNNKFVDVTTAAGLNRLPKVANLPATPVARWLARPAGTTENFMRIGHSLLVLMFALLGGQLSRYLHSRDGEHAPEDDGQDCHHHGVRMPQSEYDGVHLSAIIPYSDVVFLRR